MSSAKPVEPGSEIWRQRVGFHLDQEAGHPPSWWWLSFADPSLPKGSQNLGVCMVEARGAVEAVMVSHSMGCNPGGQVSTTWLPLPPGFRVKPECANRLFVGEDARAVAAEDADVIEPSPGLGVV